MLAHLLGVSEVTLQALADALESATPATEKLAPEAGLVIDHAVLNVDG